MGNAVITGDGRVRKRSTGCLAANQAQFKIPHALGAVCEFEAD
jgi:hypothetical protein